MSSASTVWVVLIVWPVSAIVLAWVLGRRGREERDVEVRSGPHDHADDRLDVLVGFDGSEEAHAALLAAERLLGDRIDRLTLANVAPFDPGREDDDRARSLLLEEARTVTDRPVGLELIHGPPAAALRSVALRDGYDLVVVGEDAHHTAHPLGRAARELAGSSRVPVLVAPLAHDPAGSTP